MSRSLEENETMEVRIEDCTSAQDLYAFVLGVKYFVAGKFMFTAALSGAPLIRWGSNLRR